MLRRISIGLLNYFYVSIIFDFQVINQSINFASDLHFFYPMSKVVEKRVKASSNSFYVYNFNYRGSPTLWALYAPGKSDYGIAHGDELLYLFDYNFKKNKIDKNIEQIMIDLWTSFATNGFVTFFTHGFWFCFCFVSK